LFEKEKFEIRMNTGGVIGTGDVSMQVGVGRVPEAQVLIARLTVGSSVVSMQVVATSMS
jgi:hypothetical protein